MKYAAMNDAANSRENTSCSCAVAWSSELIASIPPVRDPAIIFSAPAAGNIAMKVSRHHAGNIPAAVHPATHANGISISP